LARSGSEQEKDIFLVRFTSEARVLARLHHPRIVPIYDFGVDQGWAYIAEEFVDGGTLARRLHAPSASKSPLNLMQTLKLLTQAAHALGYAHGQGILHRDIRPSNMLLRSDHDLLLTNFGISRLFRSGDHESLDNIDGYIAPEQIDELRYGFEGPATDVYSLGVVLFECATGVLPFSSDSRSGLAAKI